MWLKACASYPESIELNAFPQKRAPWISFLQEELNGQESALKEMLVVESFI